MVAFKEVKSAITTAAVLVVLVELEVVEEVAPLPSWSPLLTVRLVIVPSIGEVTVL